jgi:predicted transcriptional regulator
VASVGRPELDECIRSDVRSATPLERVDRVDGDVRLVDEVCYDLEVEGCVRSRTGGRYSITVKGERRLRTLVATR